MTVIIARYGWHGKGHAMALFREMAEKKKWRDYTATVMWSVGRMLGGEEYPFPAYSDYIKPKNAEKPQTKAEIIGGLIDKLTA